MWDVIVIGGGAAGLWAAGTMAQRGKRVLVLEKNRKPGVKILISGGTRCNITHHCSVDGIIAAFGKQGRFLKPALYALSPDQVVAEFEQLGVATKVEPSGKVFPVSDRAIDVRDALVRRLQTHGAQLLSGVAVTDLYPHSIQAPPVAGLAELQAPPPLPTWRIQTTNETYQAEKVLLCCGGLSYPGCGTTGDGYVWAGRLGHTINATYPALTPLLSPADWVHELTGITLPDVAARVITGHKSEKDPRVTSRGGFLWTHFGCSGPVPMNLSRFVSSLPDPSQAKLLLDLVPDQPEPSLAQRLSAAGGQGRRQVATVVQEWIPRNLATRLLDRAGVSEGCTLAELPKAARLRLLDDLKRLSIPLSGTRGYTKAEVTSGGVCLKEVNPHTLESRLVPGLFLAGEILDLDGPIGGFNFQAAFSTGHTAGLHV